MEAQLVQLAKEIWANPELRFQEIFSSNAQQQFLKEQGFAIRSSIGGMETAFSATFGQGEPVIGILGEFDALSQLSQKAAVNYQEVDKRMIHGHGCGHNLLGVGSIAAAVRVKHYLQQSGKQGTVIYYGCPAEEGGSGKTFMQRDGAFNLLNIALTWHPSSVNGIMSRPTLANIQASFHFKGVASHASISPHLGRSALDAAELMNSGVNYLREHISPTARIHYAYLNAGGTSPNIVQAESELVYLVRSPRMDDCSAIFERVKRVAQGAAMMTDTAVTVKIQKACTNFLPNRALEQVVYSAFQEVGVAQATALELALAEGIWQSLSTDEQQSADDTNHGFGGNEDASYFTNGVLSEYISRYIPSDEPMYGSSDVGDVSWTVPTAQLSTACFANGTPFHSWQMVSQSNWSFAFKNMLKAGEIMATAAQKIIDDHSLLEPIQQEFHAQLAKYRYVNPLPREVQPGF